MLLSVICTCFVYFGMFLWCISINMHSLLIKKEGVPTLELLKRSHTLASLMRITNEKEEDPSLQFWLKWIQELGLKCTKMKMQV